MRTSPIISFGRNALAIKANSTFSAFAVGLQPFSSLDDLKAGVATQRYITYEQDYWLLDGNFKFKPEDNTNVHVGMMTTEMSDENGEFAGPAVYPHITIIFDEVVSSENLTLYFANQSNDYASLIEVRYTPESGPILASTFYAPGGPVFSTNFAVNNFKRIDVYFYETNKPYRYFRLTGIDLDTTTRFEGSNVKAALVVEEINMLSTELTINTAELELFSNDADFNITNPSGVYAGLQQYDPIDIHEIVGGDQIYIGRYYLAEWKSKTANEATFKAVDAVGVLEVSDFVGGFYDAFFGITLAEDVIALIFEDLDISYDLHSSFVGIGLKGWLPITTKREALQQICFRLGAYVNCARSSELQILPIELASDLVEYDHEITAVHKGLGSTLDLKELVTGVEIVSNDYRYLDMGADDIEIFNETLAIGVYTLNFNRPYFEQGWGGSSSHSIDFVSNNVWVVTITVAGSFFAEIQADAIKSELTHALYNETLDANVLPNIVKIADGVFMGRGGTPSVPDETVERVYNYYQQRYLQRTKLFAPELTVGSSVLVDTLGKQLAGIVEKMSIDLAGGFVAEAEIVGVIIEE